MASKAKSVKQGKAYTAPKGYATVHKGSEARRRRLSPTMEWIIAGIVFVLVLAALFYFGSDFRSGGTGGGTALRLVDSGIVSAVATASFV